MSAIGLPPMLITSSMSKKGFHSLQHINIHFSSKLVENDQFYQESFAKKVISMVRLPLSLKRDFKSLTSQLYYTIYFNSWLYRILEMCSVRYIIYRQLSTLLSKFMWSN